MEAVELEVPVRVSHAGFRKDYFLDLLIAGAAVVELKEVVREIPVGRDGQELSYQKAHLLNQNTAFKLTAVGDHLDAVEEHLQRFLHHTQLRALQWANIHRHEIQLTTLLNDP
jgi:hypothetical protein